MKPSPSHPAFRLLAACVAAVCSWPAGAAEQPVAAELPLERVVLFTSGVGFFQHGGKVKGDATVEMSFRSAAINDLLKSMVVEDLGGGTVPAVSYASRDPITKTLGTFAIDLTDEPSLGRILGQLRGERIEVEAAPPATGTIVGVEKRTVPVGDDKTAEKEYVTILTADGLRTLALDAITRLKLLDERLQKELEQALAVLALGHDSEKKSVTLAFAGEGERAVRVGYVQESPVWKTSYRLVLGDAAKENAGRALLQGWAIVENTTDRDWKDVRMALVSGRPISFVMDLYQPLYLPRPVVKPELLASLGPQVYGQDMDARAEEFAAKGRSGKPDRDGRRMMAARAAPAVAMAMDSEVMPQAEAVEQGEMLDGAAAIRSVAAGEALGELFRYEIAQPVTIARQRSAMLPIVAERVEAEKVSVYDDRVMPKHPLAGVRLVNSTTLDLMQGPITVFDAGAYAGDARIEDLPAGSSRLLTYAVDLDVEVAPRVEPRPEQIVSVRLVKGTLVASRKLARRKVFEIKNSGAEPVRLLVEHPLEPGWKLVEPEKPAEQTRDRFRFAVTAEPGKPATLAVVEEQLVSLQLALTDLDDGAILFYSNAKVTPPAVKQALADVVQRKREIEGLVQERARREQEVQVVGQEQERIRQNMAQLDRTSDLYTRYVQKFAAQEDRVETLRKEIADLQGKEQRARRGLDEMLGTLSLE
ncbi:MAG: hypothetical protein FJ284_01775 [Planctomycetes bacterium]|nr:hypothetical protein [Planctomycetota bacterium]